MIKIGGHWVKIEVRQLPEGDLGQFEWNTSTISIDEKAEKSWKESTLIHEILHGINTSLDGNEISHALLDSIAEQLYAVLKDNNLLNQEKFDELLKIDK